MNKLIAACAIAFIPTLGFANENNYATIVEVNPVYKNNYITRYEHECYNVEVPVYGSRTVQGSAGDQLTGAIIGGAIGNQFGSGSGKDAMTVLGAIVGANKGSTRQVQEIVGYRVEERCNKVSKTVNEPTIYKYNIRYEFNGSTYTQETTKRYILGQTVLIQPQLK